jgi:hypothetical protein
LARGLVWRAILSAIEEAAAGAKAVKKDKEVAEGMRRSGPTSRILNNYGDYAV